MTLALDPHTLLDDLCVVEKIEKDIQNMNMGDNNNNNNNNNKRRREWKTICAYTSPYKGIRGKEEKELSDQRTAIKPSGKCSP